MGSPETRPAADEPPAHSGALAQGVRCGPWRVAFPFHWARSIVEQFEMSEVPHAPHWLLGAANVDGQVVPVFDLRAYAEAAAPTPADAGAWLLLGGEGEDRLGLLSAGRPARLTEAPTGQAAPPVPPALAEFVRGTCVDDQGCPWALLDPRALTEALAADLALA